ncbi:MAG: MFS transporter [Terriglobales bacterium]|jgi:MFS family permease
MLNGEQDRVRKTLLFSILDGLGYSVMAGAGESYFLAYALFLGSSNTLLSFFLALPIFIGSLSQAFSERLLFLFKTRKRFICSAAFAQALMFLPVIALHEWSGSQRGAVLLVVVCAYWACGLVLMPSWTSLMGDLVSQVERGRFFGRRSRYMQGATFASLVVAGLLLFLFKGRNHEFTGYVVIFAIAGLARLVSFWFLTRHWEPGIDWPEPRGGLAAVVDTFHQPDRRVLVLYLSLMNLSLHLALPFYSAYMLRPRAQHGLGWSYITYTAVNGIAVFSRVLFLSLWGKASDRFGSRKCLVPAAWFFSSLPFFWLFPPRYASLHLAVICFAQMLGGFAFAAQDLCSFQLLLDSAPPAGRARLIAAMNIVNGSLILLGSAGGALIVSLAPRWVNPFLLVFLASALIRFAVSGALIGRLKEARRVEDISYGSLLGQVTGATALWGWVSLSSSPRAAKSQGKNP